MPYVVTEACIKCKYTDCVAVCPVDCFYEGETMLVIHPTECVDCGVCQPACPAKAIMPDYDDASGRWAAINEAMSKAWPQVTERRAHAPDADSHRDEDGKYAKYFSERPAERP